MLPKFSVDQALIKAKLHANKGEITEAQNIYKSILKTFSKNKRAQQGLKSLDIFRRKSNPNGLPQEIINQLLILYNKGQFSSLVENVKDLTKQYPEVFFLWNILGASLVKLGMLDQAIIAFQKVISLNPDYAEAYNNMGNVLKDQNKLDEAIEAYKKSISIKPDYADAFFNIGNAFKDQNKFDNAIEAYKKSLLIKPDYASAYLNMGVVFKDLGKLEKSIEAYQSALSIRPDFAEAYSNMGNSLKDQGKLDEAIEAYQSSISLKPGYYELYFNIGNALKDQGKFSEAIEYYKKSISIKPDYVDAFFNMGNIFQHLEKQDEAIKIYKKIISIKPDYAEAYSNTGNIYIDQCKLDEAIKYLEISISLDPGLAEAYSNMGMALKNQGKLDEAVKFYKKSISLKPGYAEAYNNLGNIVHFKGELDEAIKFYTKSISLKPDLAKAHKNLSFTLLNCGKFQEGLDKYEWRWKTDDFLSQQRGFLKPLWDRNKSLKGKRILVWSEQGIGDTINWSSCLSHLATQADYCILECQEKLVPLLKRSFPNVEVKAENRTSDAEKGDFDFHLPMGSLYKNFMEEVFINKKVNAYLVPDPERVVFWKERLKSLGKGPFIGISWKSIIMTPDRLPNYANISEWSPILTIPNATFINLQPKDFEEDLIKVKDELGVTVHNFDDIDHFNDIDDVAALCAALDMVISNKTTVPLISAGVGTSTKLANWRQSSWNNPLLNPKGPLVDIYERNTWDTWENVFHLIKKDVLEKYKYRRN